MREPHVACMTGGNAGAARARRNNKLHVAAPLFMRLHACRREWEGTRRESDAKHACPVLKQPSRTCRTGCQPQRKGAVSLYGQGMPRAHQTPATRVFCCHAAPSARTATAVAAPCLSRNLQRQQAVSCSLCLMCLLRQLMTLGATVSHPWQGVEAGLPKAKHSSRHG